MTRLADALAGVTRIGFDTAPFVYFVERHPSYLDVVREVLRLVDAGITEVLTQPLRVGNLTLADEYRRRLVNSHNLILKAIGPVTAELAAELRARHRLRTPDALQVATALEAGCEAFLCNDRGLRRATELRVLVLGDLEL